MLRLSKENVLYFNQLAKDYDCALAYKRYKNRDTVYVCMGSPDCNVRVTLYYEQEKVVVNGIVMYQDTTTDGLDANLKLATFLRLFCLELEKRLIESND